MPGDCALAQRLWLQAIVLIVSPITLILNFFFMSNLGCFFGAQFKFQLLGISYNSNILFFFAIT